MNPVWITVVVAAGSAVVSVAALVMTALSLRSGVRQRVVQALEARVERVEKEARECEQHRAELIRENHEMTRRLARLSNRRRGGDE